MPIVNAVVTAAKVTSATYRIVATAVMGYYLVKGVIDHEKQRKESKNVAATAFRNATSPNRVPPTPSRDDSRGAPEVVVAVRRRRVGPNRGRGE